MKISFLIVFALLLIGCESSQRTIPLTAAQAGAIAMRLANDRADSLFHRRPFLDGRPAQLEAGHWIWSGGHGAGVADFQARVELAADGSTNSVDVQLLDDKLIIR